jgi:hypothetical protein
MSYLEYSSSMGEICSRQLMMSMVSVLRTSDNMTMNARKTYNGGQLESIRW